MSGKVFDPKAIRELVANFAQSQVGAVSGELLLMDESRQEATTDVGLYWRYEKALRSLESDVHSIAGATGAIYAIRRELYEELPENTLLDDVLTPMRIVLKGKRTVFDPDAKAYDTVACCPLAEYGRKVRTLAGNYQLVMQAPDAIVPWRNPIFVQFLSHKVGRLLVPWALLVLFVTNLFMLRGIVCADISHCRQHGTCSQQPAICFPSGKLLRRSWLRTKARERHETRTVFALHLCADELGRRCRSVLFHYRKEGCLVEEQVLAHTQEVARKDSRLKLSATWMTSMQLAPEWTRLAEQWAVDPMFLSHTWFRTWWESFGRGKELHIVTVRDRGELVAVAPMMRTRATIYGTEAEYDTGDL